MQTPHTYFLIVFILFFNCASTNQGAFELSVVSAEKFIDGEKVYDRVGNSNYDYSDSTVDLLITPQRAFFIVQANNKTNKNIKILWDECAFVDIYNSSNRIVYGDVKYVDKNAPQVPAILVPKTSTVNVIVPVRNILDDGEYGNWDFKDLIECENDKVDDCVQATKGKTIKVYLPLLIENTKCNYLVTFKIEGLLRS